MSSLLKNIPIAKLIDAAQGMAGASETVARVSICIDRSVPNEGIEAVRKALTPVSDRGTVVVEGFDKQAYEVMPSADLLVVVGYESEAISRTVATAVVDDIPVVVCAYDAKGVYERSQGTSFPLEAGDVIDMDEEHDFAGFEKSLAEWIVANCPETRLALAAAFPFIRKPLSVDSAQKTAGLCAAVGAVPLIPGADMPVMLLLQAKMILEMAAAYGKPMTQDTLIEMAAAIPAGIGARGLARAIGSRVGFLSFATNGVVAYGATLVLGHLMHEYYVRGGLPTKAVEALSTLEDKVGSLGGGMVGDVLHRVGELGEKTLLEGGDAAGREEAAKAYDLYANTASLGWEGFSK